MKIIVGLGNPGYKYSLNRHNVGFMVLDVLGDKLISMDLSADEEWKFSKNANALYRNFRIDNKKVELVKPQTYMNASGKSLTYAVRKHKISDNNIFVVFDDLDIRLGEYKITKGKGPRDHNGLLDIYDKLGRKDFWHVRVGVDNRKKDNRIPGEDYVLMDFNKDEMLLLQPTLEEISERLQHLLLESVDQSN